MSPGPFILTYPRGFYLDQLERQRPTGVLLEESVLQVRVEITAADMELLRYDAALRADPSTQPDDHVRLLAKGTLSRIRMATAQLVRSRYSEEDHPWEN